MGRNSVQTLLVATLLLTALLAFLPVGVQAVGPGAKESLGSCRFKEVSGWWDASIEEVTVEVREAGNNLIIHYQGGGGYNHGPVDGIWIHDELDIVNLVTGKVKIIGTWDGENTIEGKTGNLHVVYWGRADAFTGEFRGKWVIQRGTDALENLRGIGTVWFDPETGPGYTLRYCFT